MRQGDTISPKLFTASLEDTFRNLNWEDKGIFINGRKLNNLRFADDVTIISESLVELETCLNELSVESRKKGLKMNMDKTKILSNAHATPGIVKVEEYEIEQVNSYIYLGQRESLREKDQEGEINRRIQAGWKSFNDNKDILKSNIPLSLKRKLYNQCILPAMTYASETWTMTKRMEQKLAASQRKMERSILGITWEDHKTNDWIRNKTGIRDIIETVKRKKWTWAGHISRMRDDRWTNTVTEWRPRDGKRARGRPMKRWRDEIDSHWRSVTWRRDAQDRCSWKNHAEAFIQQVDRYG